MFKVIPKLKLGKSPGPDHVLAEHVCYCPTLIANIIAPIFDAMLIHNVVPDAFHHGSLVPVSKDPTRDVNDAANYRGMCLNYVMLKLFERAILLKFHGYFSTNHNHAVRV